MSSTDLKDFYSDANEAAKEYGVTTKQIIDQASSWSRLGYSDKNSATEMAKLSSQFATISPGMDIDKATTGLVSTMKAKLYLCAICQSNPLLVTFYKFNTVISTNLFK